jgi:hypothetical protein
MTVYSTVARFPEDRETWLEDAWSIVLESDPPPSVQGNPSTGAVYFLADSAPQERLKAGATFELYEGARLVAEVQVL